jgi:hypothetical protein
MVVFATIVAVIAALAATGISGSSNSVPKLAEASRKFINETARKRPPNTPGRVCISCRR